MGAEETNSAYPLIIPAMVNGSEPALGGTYTTGIALLNAGSSAAQVNLTAYDGTGAPIAATQNPASLFLGPASQIPILDSQLFAFDSAASALGGVLGSSQSSLAGFALITDSEFRRICRRNSSSHSPRSAATFRLRSGLSTQADLPQTSHSIPMTTTEICLAARMWLCPQAGNCWRR
jgi:hypothetical protein